MADYTFAPVAAIEDPDKQVPSEGVIAAVDKALGARGRLVELRQRAYDAHMKRREALKSVAAGTVTVAALPQNVALDAAYEILERIMRRQVDYVDARVVDELERLAAGSIVDYEVKHSAVIAPDLRRWNRWTDKLLLGNQHPSELERLEAVACKFSGVLSKISSDVDEHDSARLYALASFTSAQRLGDDNLQAWSRGMQSMAAYGAGDFVDAVDLARLPGKHSGLQTARLAFDEAKALAKMGDNKGVVNAVERGMSSSCAEAPDVSRSDDVGGEDGLCASMTLGPYNPCRAAYFAASALAPVDVQAAYGYADQVLEAQDRQGVPCPVKRIEMGTALATAETGRDLARAADLVTIAIDQMASWPLATGMAGLREFVARTHNLDAAEIREARQLALEMGAARA